MSGINVSLELIKPLEQVAIERGESITSIVEKLIADFLRDQRHLFLMKEMDRFRSLHPGLRAQSEGTYIAMRDGHVLDHDVERLGDTPVLIVEVTDQPEQLFTRTSQRIAS